MVFSFDCVVFSCTFNIYLLILQKILRNPHKQNLLTTTLMTQNQELTVHERIKGAILGHALGDALGVGTEFMNKNEIKAYYPDGLRDFSQIIRDAHRSQWLPGETTNDTVYFTSNLESVLECNGFDVVHMARRLKQTLIELDMDIVPVYRACLSVEGWENDPIAKAETAWRKYHLYEATNDSIYRGLMAGLVSTPANVVENARLATLMTNIDTRCVAATTAVAMMANSILYTGKPASYEELAAEIYNIDGRTISFLDLAYNGRLEDFKLDDEESLMWARKAMGAALWSAWHMDDPTEILYRVVEEGGDSDTNASSACTLAGLRFGYDALPPLKEKLAKHDYFCDLADRVTRYVESL